MTTDLTRIIEERTHWRIPVEYRLSDRDAAVLREAGERIERLEAWLKLIACSPKVIYGGPDQSEYEIGKCDGWREASAVAYEALTTSPGAVR